MLVNFKKALVLFMIGIISGLGIWAANELTADTIAANIKDREESFYKEILEIDQDTLIDYTFHDLGDGVTEILVFEFENDTNVFGLIYKGEDANSYGDVTVLVGVKDDAVLKVVISDSTNTPNFVKRVEKNNLDHFIGMSTNDVRYDEKTGATFTYGSVKDLVQKSIDAYNERGDE
jgi:Na+-translocating ferredoxin:NAD+ oxidoreductase RnfG subunit